MTSQPDLTNNRSSNPIVIAALITAAAVIIAAVIGIVKVIRLPEPTTYEVTINSDKYPFEKTPIELQKGDDVEILILGADSVILNCGLGATTVMGMVINENQRNTLLPTANLCSVIGRIGAESAPNFFVGAYARFIASTSGPLFLGINDIPPERCSYLDCFVDNTGTIFVRVAVRKK